MECSICERNIRSGHDENCPRYQRLICMCGHLEKDHDEEGQCQVCDCLWFELNKDINHV